MILSALWQVNLVPLDVIGHIEKYGLIRRATKRSIIYKFFLVDEEIMEDAFYQIFSILVDGLKS